MKNIVLGLLIGFMLVMTCSARSADRLSTVKVLKIVKISAVSEEKKNDGLPWKTCGQYFDVLETKVGKIIRFAFEIRTLLTTHAKLAKAVVANMTVEAEDGAFGPLIFVPMNRSENRFILRINRIDQRAAFSCLTNSTGT